MLSRSEDNIKHRAAQLGLKKRERKRGIPHEWTPEEIEMLKARYPNESSEDIAASMGLTYKQVYSKAKALALEKSDEYLNRMKELRNERFFAHRYPGFKPGHIPVNKNRKCPQMSHPNGRKVPIGSTHISCGFIYKKISDTGNYARDWQRAHHTEWLAAGREIEEGCVLVFNDGDRSNITLDNLSMITRAELLMRNMEE